MKNKTEKADIETIAMDSWYLKGIAPKTIEFSGKIFSRYIRGGNVLELGPAEGTMTQQLARLADTLTLVEGAPTFCKILQERFPRATVVQSLFEEYSPTIKFDAIVLGHILEHVEDPLQIVINAGQWLAPGGIMLAAVPNARSIHRQAAVLMGLLKSEDELNSNDIHHGHRRVFNPETFRNVFLQARLKIDYFGGYWMKPVSNSQIEQSWTPEMLDAFMALGERYPDIAAELVIVARNEQA